MNKNRKHVIEKWKKDGVGGERDHNTVVKCQHRRLLHWIYQAQPVFPTHRLYLGCHSIFDSPNFHFWRHPWSIYLVDRAQDKIKPPQHFILRPTWAGVIILLSVKQSSAKKTREMQLRI